MDVMGTGRHLPVEVGERGWSERFRVPGEIIHRLNAEVNISSEKNRIMQFGQEIRASGPCNSAAKIRAVLQFTISYCVFSALPAAPERSMKRAPDRRQAFAVRVEA